MEINRKGERLSALLAAVALGVLGVAGVGQAAVAAPQDYGNVDTDRTGSLTVHKYLHQAGTVVGDPSAAPVAGEFTDPVAGVEFTVYPLLQGGEPVDLGDRASWDGLADLSAGPGCAAPVGYTLGDPIVMDLTAADGTSRQSLPVGLFQVCETAAPAHIVDRSLPFILTVPLPHEDGWVYDVHAYPKNGAVSIEKEIVAQEGLGLGAPIYFPVSVPIPTMQDVWTGFAIRDTLDERLTPSTTAPNANGVASVTVDDVALDPSYYTVLLAGQQITMEFTDLGVDWLNEKTHAGEVVEVVFVGEINEVGDGVIVNGAELWVNDPDYEGGDTPPIPSNLVHTNWGGLEILKRAAGTTGAAGLLEGAAFEVYASADPYAADCSTAVATGGPLTVAGQTRFTSDASGVVTVPGLFVSDSQHPAVDAPQRCYVVREVAAPAGYVLPADADHPVTVRIGQTTVTDNPAIENVQTSVPLLPLTGSAGEVTLMLLGVGAILASVGVVLIRHRRSAARQ